MRFSDVIGQEEIKYKLTETVYNNRVSHALLFLGKDGAGALPMAIAFAQFLVCEKIQWHNSDNQTVSLFGDIEPNDKTLMRDACGVCSSCLRAGKLMHPDIHFSYPVVSVLKKRKDQPDESDGEKKKGNRSIDFIEEWRDFICQMPYGNVTDWIERIKETPNQQGKITANECYDIVTKLSLKSFESGYKIWILWMPEMLAKEANILLKSLEEPPPDTLFILVAEDEGAILPTILSRTQLVKIPALTDDEIEAALITRGKVESNKARQIAGVCSGNYRESLQMLQNAEEDWQSLLREWLNAIAKNNIAAQIKWIEEISKLGRERQKQFLRYFIHLLEQAVRVRMIDESSTIKTPFSNMPEKEKDFANRLNKLCSLSAQEAIITELDKATYYIERNANAKMLFHALCIRLFHIIKDNSLILVN